MQWLVFRRDGSETGAAWAQKAAEATATNSSIGDGDFFDIFEPQRRLQRRQAFICSILRQTMQVTMAFCIAVEAVELPCMHAL